MHGPLLGLRTWLMWAWLWAWLTTCLFLHILQTTFTTQPDMEDMEAAVTALTWNIGGVKGATGYTGTGLLAPPFPTDAEVTVPA